MKKGDFLIIAIIIVASLLSFIPVGSKSVGRSVTITEDGSIVYHGDLSTDTVIRTKHNVIEILNSHVRMIEADCPDRLCIQCGEATIFRPIICLPNRLVIQIHSIAEEGTIDAISY